MTSDTKALETDLLDTDSLLDDDERDLRRVVREFAWAKVEPRIAEWFESGHPPEDEIRALMRELGGLGLLGMHLEGYGCAGTSATAYGLACLELDAVDAALRSMVSVQGSLAMYAIRRFGSEEQRQRWLPGMAAGELIGCFGLTEPDAGSDPASMRTTARRDGDEWVLNGGKMWITNGTIANVAVVWARVVEGDGSRGRVRGFLVPTETPGFRASLVPRKLSLRASLTAELTFDNVRLPADAMLPEADGLGAPLSCLNEARFGIVFGVMGAARTCLQTARDYSLSRVQFGKPIASFQLTQAKLTEMAVAVGQGTLLAIHLGRLKDAGRLRPEQVSAGKYANVASALDVARTARTVLGGSGITLDYPVMRHAANLETVLTYEGTHEMHTLVVGQALTGINAFR
ncbi:MAG: acyl-CoA dehydrogenase family protein [Actinomycetales bacterium]